MLQLENIYTCLSNRFYTETEPQVAYCALLSSLIIY